MYRRGFAESGVDPASIRTLDDLPRLPLLDRRAVMAAPRDFAVQPLRLMWPSRSSGTSGQPITVYRTPGSSAFEQAALQRQWGWFGLPRDARRVVLRGSSIAVDRGVLTHEIPGDHQLLVSSFHPTPEALPEILRAIRAFRPHAVEGWTSSLTLLAARLRDAGERLPVQAVITSSETISTLQRELMSAVFQAPIVDHYGQTERVAMASNCEAGGYHVFPDYGIVELLPMADGRAEIVGTPLHNWGFPLLRYRTGDFVGPAPSGPCPCGRAFPRLGAVAGRSEDAFVASDGRLIPLPSEGITQRLHELGNRLATGIRQVTTDLGVADHLQIRGRASNLVFATLDPDGKPSQPYRTLLLRQLLTGGIIGPSFVVSAALTNTDIDHTIDVVAHACTVYKKALDAGDPTPWMGGRPVKPVFRRYV